MIKNIWIFCIEPLESRYTQQWYTNIPKILKHEITNSNLPFNVITVDGIQNSGSTTPGAFLDFTDTNYYKSSQLCKFIEYMREGKVGKHDKILFTDFWNPCITQIAYMRDLMDQEWELHSIAHAGAYDPTDILGYKMQKPWPWHMEKGWFYVCDYTYFATDFHKHMFLHNLGITADQQHRAVRSGQPHDPIIESLEVYQQVSKDPVVMWPHRYNADKQPEIAEDLAQSFDFVITQKMNLSKPDYYAVMGRSQVIFSCALHENLGISVMEGCLAGAIPVLPDRASYAEMYLPEFKYPSEWTSSIENFKQHRAELTDFIKVRLDNPEQFSTSMRQQREILKRDYLNASIMIKNLLAER